MTFEKAKAVSALMYIISACGALCLFLSDIISLDIGHYARFITALFVFSIAYFAGFLRCVYSNIGDNSPMRRCIQYIFLLYLLMLADSTLINSGFGRNVSYIFSFDASERLDYILKHINFIPMRTVKLFIDGFKNGSLSFSAAVENLMGNLIIFMPLPFFLQTCFKKVKKTYQVLFISALSISAVEIMQLVLLTGSADIDDFILNAAGAAISCFVLRTKHVSAAVEKITFGVWGYGK